MFNAVWMHLQWHFNIIALISLQEKFNNHTQTENNNSVLI